MLFGRLKHWLLHNNAAKTNLLLNQPDALAEALNMHSDIEHYSLEELAEIQGGIDRKANPERYQLVSELLDRRLSEDASTKPEIARADFKVKINYIDEKYVWLIRLAWLLLSAILTYWVIVRLGQDTLNRLSIVYHKGEVSHILRAIWPMPIAIMGFWFGTGGTRAKKK